MDIRVAVGDIASSKDAAVVVNLFEGVTKPAGATAAIDKELGGAIANFVAAGDFRGKFKECFVFPTLEKIPAARVFLVGLGKREDFTLDRIREVSAKAVNHARGLRLPSFATIVHGAGVARFDLGEATEAAAEGALLASYRFTRYKTRKDEDEGPSTVTLVTPERRNVRAVEKAVRIATATVDAVSMARDMVNAPSNDKTPRQLAGQCEAMAKQVGLKCTVLDEKQIQELGMGAFWGVARGSAQPPRFVVLEWRGGPKTQKPIALVGKGITFDTGGISLKPQEGQLGQMWEMKYDMAGAATVFATLRACAELKLPVNVVGIAPCTENMPGGNAQKPGDIVRTIGGKTIEVINTDAEGRLVLADGIGYAMRYDPQVIIDIATLTGAAVIALGKKTAAAMGTDRKTIKRILAASKETGERFWEMPTWDEYAEQIKSDFADVKNVGGRPGGAITAAKFLETFTEGRPWVHLDIAGPVWNDGGVDAPKREYHPKGATGVPVRTLVRMLRDWSAA
jgi:leucyl aminopeptidase